MEKANNLLLGLVLTVCFIVPNMVHAQTANVQFSNGTFGVVTLTSTTIYVHYEEDPYPTAYEIENQGGTEVEPGVMHYYGSDVATGCDADLYFDLLPEGMWGNVETDGETIRYIN